MRVEVLNTGSELLFGSVINTHLAFLARALFPLGLRIARQTTVPDGGPIRDALESIAPTTDLILVTGGLGPTSDDVTRDVVAAMLDRKLIRDESVLASIRARFAKRGLQMPPNVARQADVPTGAVILHNPHGTAPGLYFQPVPGRIPHLFLLPGPPRELHPMVEDQVLPILRSLPNPARPDTFRIFRIHGLGESQVEARIDPELSRLADLELGYCARPGEVDVRLIGPTATVEIASEIVRSALGEAIFSENPDESLASTVIDQLAARHATLAIAESCTGGTLSGTLTNVPGASSVFLAGYVTYSNESKSDLLAVDPNLIAANGAVSEPVARAMALGARSRSGSTYAISITGIAGPEGGSLEKPVGTAFIGLASPDGSVAVSRHRFSNERSTFKALAVQTALNHLRLALSQPPTSPERPARDH